MVKDTSFAVIGGDLRQVQLAEALAEIGYPVHIYGFDCGVELSEKLLPGATLEQAMKPADCVILPLPYSVDGLNINAPFCRGKISVDIVLGAVEHRQTVVGGRLSEKVFELAGRRGFKMVDYFEREELAVLNAVPTAEGAIQLAMEELPITLHDSRCLIIGFGRIGKVLARDLQGLGAKVTVAARKCSDHAWVRACAYTAVGTAQLADVLPNMDVVFNTAPAMVLDERLLKKLSPKCLVIDLASKPGGVDFAAAQSIGVKTIWALSLPGKVAPVTSGQVIKDTVLNILEEAEEICPTKKEQ